MGVNLSDIDSNKWSYSLKNRQNRGQEFKKQVYMSNGDSDLFENSVSATNQLPPCLCCLKRTHVID